MHPLAPLPKQNSSVSGGLKQLLGRPLRCEGMVPGKKLNSHSMIHFPGYFAILKLAIYE